MLKTRIIGVILIKADIVVQSIGFKKFLPIGKPEIAIHYLDRWGVDEIVVLHLDAREKHAPPSEKQVKSYAAQCQVPLSVGGGITSITDIKKMIRSGADKVIINSSLITNPEIITQGSDLFGQQSMVASIDAHRQKNTFIAYTHSGKQNTTISVINLAQQAIKLGAGEIFVNSIDRDGSKMGFELDLIQSLSKAVSIPVIACGGAGHPSHIQMAIQQGAAAVAIGNLLHFTEHSVTIIKQYLHSAGESIRLDSKMKYHQFTFDEKARPTKLPDKTLDALRFHSIPEEVI
jgi:cyclase